MELSVIIVIIGLLIAGATQGSRIFTKSRLGSAQTLTTGSTVATTRGLVLWLESSMPESFLESETNDGSQLTTWKDINPQATTKYTATTSASAAITYKYSSDIYSIPSVYFNGTSSAVLTLNDVSGNTPIFTPNNAFSFFIVSKLEEDSASSKTIFSNGNTSGWGYGLSGSQNSRNRNILLNGATDDSSTSATSTTKAEIISATYEGGSSAAVKLFTNGVAESLTSNNITVPSPATAFYIGNKSLASPWKGYISEIIIFNRALSTSERSEIEKYLGQKYGISLASS